MLQESFVLLAASFSSVYAVGDAAVHSDNNSRKTTSLGSTMDLIKTSVSSAASTFIDKLGATARIVGGKQANEYPSYGFSAGSDLCAGTLIHPDILLTAGIV